MATVTFLLTLFFSFGVQSLFYLYFRCTNNKVLKFKHVFNYYSGIIGDGILIPLLNVFAVKILLDLNGGFSNELIFLSLIAGIFITFIFHFGQSYFNQINWTMPQKNQWNILGLYHCIFMFFESSFLVFTLLIFCKYAPGFERIIYSSFGLGGLVLFLFFLTFMIDYWKSLFRKYLL